ncbi:MAG: hypothetical protein P8Y46_08130 [Sulfurovaceae bacterium]
MKLLKLFLLLSIGLLADIMPSGIKMEQLSPIIENGWNDHNQTLNQLIIDNGQKKLHEILTGLDEPFSKKGKSFRETPNFLLTRDDYYFIFSYVKYLEYQGKIDQAIEVYIRALKGLAKIKNDSVIGYIYHLVMEKITVESINQMIKTKKVNTKQLINIKEELQSALFLNNTVFLDTVINELGNDEISLTQDGLNRENDLNIQIAGKTLFYTATLSPEHFFEMKKDIDEEIKRNRALLKSLER